MSDRYRKKPIVISARRWNGTAAGATPVIDWVLAGGGTARYHDPEPEVPEHIAIDTLEGVMRADTGDWIIRGVEGEHYPCKPSVFVATYEPVSEADQ